MRSFWFASEAWDKSHCLSRKKYRATLVVLTLVGREVVVALKGGTAINFFVRDLPCVSVAIDEAIPYIRMIFPLAG
jgi:hypothetical protein